MKRQATPEEGEREEETEVSPHFESTNVILMLGVFL